MERQGVDSVGWVRPRGPWGAAWFRIRRDRWTVAALVAMAVVLLLSLVGGPVMSRLVGHNGDQPFPYAVIGSGPDARPVSLWTRVPATTQTFMDDYGNLRPPPHGKTALLVLGADGPLGRDELLRFLDGGRTSLEVGLGGVLFALLVSVPIGAAAGYFGGWLDVVVSRWTETLMAFPLLLFLVFATVRLSPHLGGVQYGTLLPKGVFSDALLIGVFTSFYPLRLIRAQLLTLRHADFVEAARMVGARDGRILWRHLMPHVVPTILIWGAIAVATNILLEVSLSFIGVGVQPSTPTWGSLLSTAWGTIYTGRAFNPTLWQTVVPTAGIVVTVAALNQISEGLRRALEPWGRR